MKKIDVIFRSVGPLMEQADLLLRQVVTTDEPTVGKMVGYLLDNRGKGIRPALVLMSASLHAAPGQQPGGDALMGAALAEIIHLTSLVHDDVVDSSAMRRGAPSANALWESKASVLLGDYLLSRAITRGMERGCFEVLRQITLQMDLLCQSELLQHRYKGGNAPDKAVYFDIIHGKTAVLMGNCCAAGAVAVGADAGQIEVIRQFGEALGMAFQIRDDMLDFAPSEQTGKPSCGDLLEGRITLPLLVVLDKADEKRRAEILGMVGRLAEEPGLVGGISHIVRDEGGMEGAQEYIRDYTNKALAILEGYPDSQVKRSMAELCDYLAGRES